MHWANGGMDAGTGETCICRCRERPPPVQVTVFNGMPLGKLHLLAAACTPMAVVQVLTGCNLC